MKTLNQLEKNEIAIVRKIYATGDLKQRLSSFGVFKGTEIKVESCSVGKQTMKVKVGKTKIAFRLEEAKQIEVE